MQSAKILVVEDEPIVATDIEEDVQELGYSVCSVVDTGEEAIEAAEKFRPDLVLMDIRLAGKLDGIDAASEIRQRFGIPAVYLTAHSDESTLQRAKITEPFGYVLKPFEQVELRIALEMALYKKEQEELAQGSEQGASLGEVNHSAQRNEKYSLTESEQKIVGFLREISPFSHVPEPVLVELCKRSRLISYKQGDLIVLEGDNAADSGFVVFSGRVAMVKSSLSGKELIVELLPAGDVLGLVTAVQKDPYPFTVRAQSKSELLHIPRHSFFKLLTQAPELYRKFIEEMNARLQAAHNSSRALAHDRVEVRVASALLRLSADFANKSERSDSIEIYITRQELADLTGTTVETAIRTTRAFEKQGVLDLSNAGIVRINDEDQLMRIAQE